MRIIDRARVRISERGVGGAEVDSDDVLICQRCYSISISAGAMMEAFWLAESCGRSTWSARQPL